MEDYSISQIHTEDVLQHSLPPSTNGETEKKEIKKSEEDNQREIFQPKVVRRKDRVSEDMMRIIKNMRRRGYKAKEISILTDLTKGTIKKCISKIEDNKPLIDETSSVLKKRGRKKSENTDLQEKIQSILHDNDGITLKTMKDRLKDGGYGISVSYLSKTIKKMGIKRKPSQQNIQVRKSDEHHESQSIQDTSVIVPNQSQQDSLPPPVNPLQ
ncbi:hypothetical protein ENU1_070380 [Entamoeba nuttalli P19]|uniref:Uncharacterized protein n=1 Tax=Entamoeba nuttalli (strain P19) TaxID=1076696 RepID=K2GEI8_ENTNP|nr:hypothetical protein ENU1_070380 [Entamoeba nuttalli P19]EKE41031.1 hypothetical protein ENU1_070380 [Entamoeba nuttalli P19]|eukprot:XP_008856634.1 hypothetical protein ENU1_070380 [Entamoeba nuttalli P19]